MRKNLSMVLLGSLLASPGFAADPFALTSPAATVVADAETLLALGPDGGLVVDLATGEHRPVEIGADDAVLSDFGGDATHLLTCSADGLRMWSWPAREPLTHIERPCTRLAALARGVIAVGEGAARYALYQGKLIEEMAVPLPEGTDLIATAPGLVAFAVAGEPGVTELSSRGLSTIATGAAVGGLASYEGQWVWSVTKEDRITGLSGGDVLTGRDPGELVRIDLDGDGTEELLVRHAGRIGIVSDGVEQQLSAGASIDAMTADGRSCASIWVASGLELREVERTCVEPVQTVAAPPVAEVAVAPVAPAPSTLTLDGRQIPELVATVGHPMRVVLQDAQSRRMLFSARGGPSGLVVLPDGVLTYEPKAEQVGDYMISVRMSTGLTQRRATIRLRVVDGTAAAPAGPSGAESDYRLIPRSRSFRANSCSIGVGVSSAVSAVANTWEFAGQAAVGSVSPTGALVCEGHGKGRWFVRAATSPTLFYVTPFNDPVVSVLTASLGYMYGSESVRVGAYGMLGIVAAGAGIRAAFAPFKIRKGDRRHGPELDLAVYTPSVFAAGLSLLWTAEL